MSEAEVKARELGKLIAEIGRKLASQSPFIPSVKSQDRSEM